MTSGIVSDVAYDLFTSATSGGAHEYEVMIWLANYNNARPISYTYSSSRVPKPVGSTLSLGGHMYMVQDSSALLGCAGQGLCCIGTCIMVATGNTMSFCSFLPRGLSTFANICLQYLITNKGLPSSQHLITAQAGTEPTLGGPVTFITFAYKFIRKLGRHWYDQTVMTRANLVDAV